MPPENYTASEAAAWVPSLFTQLYRIKHRTLNDENEIFSFHNPTIL